MSLKTSPMFCPQNTSSSIPSSDHFISLFFSPPFILLTNPPPVFYFANPPFLPNYSLPDKKLTKDKIAAHYYIVKKQQRKNKTHTHARTHTNTHTNKQQEKKKNNNKNNKNNNNNNNNKNQRNKKDEEKSTKLRYAVPDTWNRQHQPPPSSLTEFFHADTAVRMTIGRFPTWRTGLARLLTY